MRAWGTIAGLAVCVAASTVSAQGRPPAAVLAAVQDMDTMCREFGTPGDKSGLLQTADLNGDGVTDWVLDQGVYVCNGAASLFGGTGGSPVSVWAGQPGGGASAPFTHYAQGARIESGRVWLTVGGELCGKGKAGLSRADMEYCERPLAWNARAGTFDWAPLGEIRPLS